MSFTYFLQHVDNGHAMKIILNVKNNKAEIDRLIVLRMSFHVERFSFVLKSKYNKGIKFNYLFSNMMKYVSFPIYLIVHIPVFTGLMS